MNSQKGSIPLLFLVATLGLLTFILFSNIFIFRNRLFSELFLKTPSQATSIKEAYETASPSASLNPLDPVPTTIPSNLTANAVSSSQINLSWNPSTDTDNVAVSGYQVFRNNSNIATVNTTSFGDTGLTPQTTYTYFVKALDSSGNISNPSNNASATTNSVPSQVGTISGTVSSSAGGTIAGAKISLIINKAKSTYITNSFGQYSISNVPAGTYKVYISQLQTRYISLGS